MARRRRRKQKNSIEEIIAGIALIAPFFFIYSVTGSIGASVFASFVAVAMVIAFIFYRQMAAATRLRNSGIAEIDKMDGRQFEKYLGLLFSAQGYKAEVTQAAGDYGADLVLTKSGQRIVVQAKRYSKNVGLKAVQEVYGAVAHYRASSAWVVTNSDYTEQAYKLARSNNVRLINREQLIEIILQVKQKNSVTRKAG
ncbi:restriction endonuclease [Paenibacillus polymyxa]|uniref:restriction endonuclease n=1 Tax=Paenibacillus polymyxa TaxID=1406 RepID=UPI0020242F7A|nr:restriction endonuclease [Paenibacillus polymyxa]URJ45222.1 restriction endonuclease [Paenibacillus polymyxa]